MFHGFLVFVSCQHHAKGFSATPIVGIATIPGSSHKFTEGPASMEQAPVKVSMRTMSFGPAAALPLQKHQDIYTYV